MFSSRHPEDASKGQAGEALFHAQSVSKGRHRRHANPFSIRHDVAPLDVHAHFGRHAPLALDIGCGPGAYVLALARAFPNYNVLGLEIRQHLVDVGRALLAHARVPHADIVLANANLHLDTLLPDDSVTMVSVNFADPWFKKRHHKRRVVTASMAALLARKLTPDGVVHVMTDVEALAKATRAVLRQAHFRDEFAPETWPQKSTTGLQSERELWHQARGDVVWRMQFRAPVRPSRGASNRPVPADFGPSALQ